MILIHLRDLNLALEFHRAKLPWDAGFPNVDQLHVLVPPASTVCSGVSVCTPNALAKGFTASALWLVKKPTAQEWDPRGERIGGEGLRLSAGLPDGEGRRKAFGGVAPSLKVLPKTPRQQKISGVD